MLYYIGRKDGLKFQVGHSHLGIRVLAESFVESSASDRQARSIDALDRQVVQSSVQLIIVGQLKG